MIGLFRAALICTITLPLIADAIDSSWTNLKTAVQDRYGYSTVILRNRSCISGHISKFDADSLAISESRTDPAAVTLQRGNVLRVLSGSEPTDTLYSGRSSWDDVRAVATQGHEHLRLELKSGKAITGAPVSSSESQLTLHHLGKDFTVEKNDIAHAYFVHKVYKTPSRDANYVFEEASILAPFFPQTWPYLFDVGTPVTVRLYDSSIPEDNVSVSCPAAR